MTTSDVLGLKATANALFWRIGRSEMAETGKKRRGEIQKTVLEVLHENPEGIQAKDVIAKVADRLTLSDYERGEYPNFPGAPRFNRILRFLTISPVKAGWMTKEKGTWTLNEAGEKAIREYPDPLSLNAEAARQYRVWKQGRPKKDDTEEEDEEGPSSTTLEEAEETAWAEIQDFLADMNPFDFQKLVAGLLKGMNYYVSWISPPGPDRGIDVVAHLDPLGVEGPRIKVQVKRTPGSKINVESLRAFMSTLGDNDVGLFVASGGFTSDAQRQAREQEKRRITLLDLQDLFDLWVEHYDSIPDAERSLLPLRFVPYLAPEN